MIPLNLKGKFLFHLRMGLATAQFDGFSPPVVAKECPFLFTGGNKIIYKNGRIKGVINILSFHLTAAAAKIGDPVLYKLLIAGQDEREG